jgi:hypothetical protein
MSMVALSRMIGSAFFVVLGKFGQVSQFAREHGVSRQSVYRDAQRVQETLDGASVRAELERLHTENAALRDQVTQQQQRLDVAVVLDDEKQAELASVGQACGVTLSQCHTLLEVLIPGQASSIATLGRRTQASGQKAGALLEVLDEFTRPLVRDAAADEIFVRDPVLMVVEQESLCWVTGHLTELNGAAWSEELKRLPHLEQVARDGGSSLAKGIELVNAQREVQNQEPVLEQGDHFHALRRGGVGLRRFETRANAALNKAEAAQKKLEECIRQGQSQAGVATRAKNAWRQAEAALDEWIAMEKLWQRVKDALRLITPEGELNTRAKAEAVLAEVLPQLPESEFGKSKRQLEKPEMLNYLDRVEEQLQKLPMPEDVKRAAVRQEVLRRQPNLLKGDHPKAAAMHGVMLMCAVVLSKAGESGQQAASAVREIFRRAYRASSLVECINSVLRMQQAQHRNMTQGLLDLKRLYWNCHRFRAGRRRHTTPYERLGVPWPKGLAWWDVLKLTPEQLRTQLSTTKTAK